MDTLHAVLQSKSLEALLGNDLESLAASFTSHMLKGQPLTADVTQSVRMVLTGECLCNFWLPQAIGLQDRKIAVQVTKAHTMANSSGSKFHSLLQQTLFLIFFRFHGCDDI